MYELIIQNVKYILNNKPQAIQLQYKSHKHTTKLKKK